MGRVKLDRRTLEEAARLRRQLLPWAEVQRLVGYTGNWQHFKTRVLEVFPNLTDLPRKPRAGSNPVAPKE